MEAGAKGRGWGFGGEGGVGGGGGVVVVVVGDSGCEESGESLGVMCQCLFF